MPMCNNQRRNNRYNTMSQSKKQSLLEAITNTAVGFGISLLSIFIILPLLGIHSTPGKNIAITLYFTVISIARSYVLRRFFNRVKKIKQAQNRFPYDAGIEALQRCTCSDVNLCEAWCRSKALFAKYPPEDYGR